MGKRIIKSAILIALLLALSSLNSADAFLIGGVPTTGGAVSACSYSPPLDAQTGAAAAYSFRVLKSTWIGQNIVKIRRSSDNTTKIFTASAPGCGINTSDAFLDGSTYTIDTWYDQSGNGNNLAQATQANQPTITLSCQNSHPCAVFNGTSDSFSATLGSSVSANTMAAVGSVAIGSGTCLAGSNTCFMALLGSATDSSWIGYRGSLSACVDNRTVASTSHSGTEACSANTFYRIVGTSTNTLSSIYLNGTKGTDETNSATMASTAALFMGVGPAASNWLTGKISEYILFAPDLSITNSNTVSSNQGSYWSL